MRRVDASTDGQDLRNLCALNLGPHCCLQAVDDESELVCSESGFPACLLCSD
jgi:hypothetical protein